MKPVKLKQKDSDKLYHCICRSLQGFAYWIGWTHSRNYHWPLAEGAMVAELRAAIAAEIYPPWRIAAEVATDRLIAKSTKLPRELREGRVDIVIIKRHIGTKYSKDRNIANRVVMLIEVKRGQSKRSELEKDIVRLVQLCGNARAFLVVGCEAGKIPAYLIEKNGYVRKEPAAIQTKVGRKKVDLGYYKTCKILRANPANRHSKQAHTAVLVEIFPGKNGT